MSARVETAVPGGLGMVSPGVKVLGSCDVHHGFQSHVGPQATSSSEGD